MPASTSAAGSWNPTAARPGSGYDFDQLAATLVAEEVWHVATWAIGPDKTNVCDMKINNPGLNSYIK